MISKNKLRPIVEKPFVKKRIVSAEAKRIYDKLNINVNKVTIIYDNLVSPPSYGDFLEVVMLARVFLRRV